jgi:hypothetical protein
MTGSAAGITPVLRHEAAGAAPSGSAYPEASPSALGHHPVDSLSQRERSKGLLIGSIKQAVSDMVLGPGKAVRMKNSDYLSRRLSHDYTYLANLFSEATGGTIEQYIIEFRIDWVKEFIVAGEFNLTQMTGLTPSAFKILHFKPGIIPESVNDATIFCNRVKTLEVRRVSFAM